MGPGEINGPRHSRSSANASELGRRCAPFTTPLKDRQQTHVCQAHVSLVAFNPSAPSSELRGDLMLETAIVLIVGFAVGYGVREWLSRRRRQAERERRKAAFAK